MLVKLKRTWFTAVGRFRARDYGVPIPDELFDILPSGSIVLEAPKGREKHVDDKGEPKRNKKNAAKIAEKNAGVAKIVVDDKLGKPVDPTKFGAPPPQVNIPPEVPGVAPVETQVAPPAPVPTSEPQQQPAATAQPAVAAGPASPVANIANDVKNAKQAK